MSHRDNKTRKAIVATPNCLAVGPKKRVFPSRATKKTHPARTTALKSSITRISSVVVLPPGGGRNRPKTCRTSQEKNKPSLQTDHSPAVANTTNTKIEKLPLENKIILTMLICFARRDSPRVPVVLFRYPRGGVLATSGYRILP